MRTNRGVYLAIFLFASAIAAGAYWLAQPRAEVVRARTDIAVLTQITADMVEVIWVSPGDRPADAATRLDEVLGRYAALPLLSGQYIDRRGLETTPGQVAFGFGAPLPDGHVAFAVAVDPAQAVGGALTPGARVDVVAVPSALRTASGEEAPETRVLGRGVLVLSLRSVEGRALGEIGDDSRSATTLPPRLGSVVLAVPADELPTYAAAAADMTLFLALTHTADAPTGSP